MNEVSSAGVASLAVTARRVGTAVVTGRVPRRTPWVPLWTSPVAKRHESYLSFASLSLSRPPLSLLLSLSLYLPFSRSRSQAGTLHEPLCQLHVRTEASRDAGDATITKTVSDFTLPHSLRCGCWLDLYINVWNIIEIEQSRIE